MHNIVRALALSIIDLFHPRILLLIFIPPVLALIFWCGVAWLFWDVFLSLGNALFSSADWLIRVTSWLRDTFNIETVTVAVFLVLLLVIFPLVVVTTLVLTNIIAMPIILSHEEKNYFKGLERKGDGQLRKSLLNASRAFGVFAVAWVVSIPFWSIPILGPMLSFAVIAYLNTKIFVFDSLNEHADSVEMQNILQNRKWELYALGAVVTSLILVPILNFILPVYGGLAFARYGLERLKVMRQ